MECAYLERKFLKLSHFKVLLIAVAKTHRVTVLSFSLADLLTAVLATETLFI